MLVPVVVVHPLDTHHALARAIIPASSILGCDGRGAGRILRVGRHVVLGIMPVGVSRHVQGIQRGAKHVRFFHQSHPLTRIGSIDGWCRRAGRRHRRRRSRSRRRRGSRRRRWPRSRRRRRPRRSRSPSVRVCDHPLPKHLDALAAFLPRGRKSRSQRGTELQEGYCARHSLVGALAEHAVRQLTWPGHATREVQRRSLSWEPQAQGACGGDPYSKHLHNRDRSLFAGAAALA